ncbi:hypothetical protein O8C85_00775 [Aliarcobacter butzleri]|uniref:hypothetical protein n=1 Tax=Aliarcobacter butzleri TaxID=28197 RepID=UPI00263E05E8|nr:hypothetical protein [Aliarcobacter butzleri]MDN5097065.1 hypothetical protein [Aliarcobacter butzleri]
MFFFKNISDWLTSNPYLNLIFFLLSIISILLTIFFYYKSKKTKEPRYLYKSFSLIENSLSALDGLEIIYNKEKIDTLTLTKFAIWNNGNDVIEGSDVARSDKLRISLAKDKKIINVKSIFNRKIANNILIEISNNEVLINFDFLDFGDGAIFEVYHTGNVNEKITMNGTIKGANKIKWGSYEKDYLSNKFVNNFDSVLPEPKNIILKFIYFIIFIPIVLPILIPLLLIDSFLLFIHKIPKDYNLFNDNKENIVDNKSKIE